MFPVKDISAYTSKKIVDINRATKLISDMKDCGKIVGLCHGGFDLLHPGHVKHLESAKKMCDFLFVSLTTDVFISERKGSGKPVYTDKIRAYMVAGLEVVDYAIIANYKTCVEMINFLKPSLYIKGPDIKNLDSLAINAERKMIKRIGGEIKYTNDEKLATAEIIDYIKKYVK